MATAAVALAAAVTAFAAVVPSGSARAQEVPRILGTWVPVERAVPDPLPLKAPPPARAEPECAAPGMPALLDTRAAIEITQRGDRILMRYVEWDTTRTVYTNPRSGPPTQEPSPLGVSFGRWEGQTLAIFTTYIAHPYFDRSGTRQSAAVTVLERYTSSADRTRLEWKATVTDAATFTAPVAIAGAMVARAEVTDAKDAPNASPAPPGDTEHAAAPLVAGGCVG